MIELQNNYTTPEQSKRLLELGVPADSADCSRFREDFYPEVLHSKYSEYMKKLIFTEPEEYTPCWSVGRLIEIYEICFGGYFNSRYFGHTLMEDILLKIEEQIDSMDFSKLEQ